MLEFELWRTSAHGSTQKCKTSPTDDQSGRSENEDAHEKGFLKCEEFKKGKRTVSEKVRAKKFLHPWFYMFSIKKCLRRSLIHTDLTSVIHNLTFDYV